MASCWSRERPVEAKLFDALDHFPQADDPMIKDDGGSMAVSVARATTTLLIPDILPSSGSTVDVQEEHVILYMRVGDFVRTGWRDERSVGTNV